MKAKEIINVAEWIDGSGWAYNTIYSTNIVDIAENIADQSSEEFFKDFEWEKEERENGHDLQITVRYFPEDYDPMFDDCDPLAEFEEWESKL